MSIIFQFPGSSGSFFFSSSSKKAKEKKKDKTAWRREHPEVDSVFALPGLFSNVEAVFRSLLSSLLPLERKREEGRGERTTGHMLREGRVEVEEICLLVTSEWSSGMKISFPGLIVVPLSTPERTVSRLMVYERKRKG